MSYAGAPTARMVISPNLISIFTRLRKKGHQKCLKESIQGISEDIILMIMRQRH
jgi:hypothetical protein